MIRSPGWSLSGSRQRFRLLVPATLVLGIVAVLVFSSPVPAPGQAAVDIEGRVLNGTAGAEAPVDLAILLLIADAGGTLAGTGQAPLQSDGSFVIPDVPVIDGAAYTVSVDYGGIFYGESLSLAQALEPVSITVYDPTEDASILRIDRQVMVLSEFDAAGRTATATEFVRLTNPTDRTLRPNLETARPGMFSFMRFALPPDAADVTVQSSLRGGDVISVGTGFALTAPVPPGEHSVDFAYTFPYEGGTVDFRNSLPQGAGIFQVLVPSRWDSVEISGIVRQEPVVIGSETYRAWETRDVPPGPGVQLTFTGLPQPGILARTGNTLSGESFWITAIPSAMGAILLALLVIGLFRRYRPETVTVEDGEYPDEDPSAPSPVRRAEAVASLAVLDEQYYLGAIEPDIYFQRRASLVSEALSGESEQGP